VFHTLTHEKQVLIISSLSSFQFLANFSLKEFGEDPVERVKRFRSIIHTLLFTDAAKEIAREEIEKRFLEYGDKQNVER